MFWFYGGSVVDQVIDLVSSSGCFLLPQASLWDFKITDYMTTK